MAFARWLRSELRALPAGRRAAPRWPRRVRLRRRRPAATASGTAVLAAVFVPVYRRLPWRLRRAVIAARCRAATGRPGRRSQRARARPSDPPASAPDAPAPVRPRRRHSMPQDRRHVPPPEEGDVLYDTEEKVFEDIQAEPGEKAFVFIHTVPVRGLGRAGQPAHRRPASSARASTSASSCTARACCWPRHPRLPGRRQGGLPGQPGDQQPAQDAHGRGRHDLRLPLRHGRAVRLPRGRPDPRASRPFNPLDVLDSALTAWRAGGLPAQHLDRLRREPRPAPATAPASAHRQTPVQRQERLAEAVERRLGDAGADLPGAGAGMQDAGVDRRGRAPAPPPGGRRPRTGSRGSRAGAG